MRGPRIILSLPLLACLAAAPTSTPVAAPEEKPATLGEAKAREQVEALTEVAKLPIINAQHMSEVLTITLRENDLALATRLSPTDDCVVRVPGLAGVSRMRVIPSQVDSTQVIGFEFRNIDYAPPDVIAVQTTVGMAGGHVSVCQDFHRLDDETHTVQLLQRPPEAVEGEPRVTLFVQITGAVPVKLSLTANNVVELRREHPAEVSRYVDPIFRTLKQNGFLARIEPRLAWQVFADTFDPPAELRSQVKELIAKLDADDFRQREKASAALEQLGEPAALMVMRLDRKQLSAEQRGRVDAFLAKFKLIPDTDAVKLQQDRDFLLDCLFSDEEAIRRAALAKLREVTGQPIAFDVSADADARLAALTRLREQFGAAATTQSAPQEESPAH